MPERACVFSCGVLLRLAETTSELRALGCTLHVFCLGNGSLFVESAASEESAWSHITKTFLHSGGFAFQDGRLFRLSNGEFDPGSGRTLAACLKNASRAVPVFHRQERTGNRTRRERERSLFGLRGVLFEMLCLSCGWSIGIAANGRVTRKQPAPKTGTTPRKGG